MTTGLNWFDANEARRYPLADDADVGGLPDDIIADLKLVVPSAIMDLAPGELPRVVSLSCGPGYISVVIAVGSKEVAWYGGDPAQHALLALTPLATGAGGFIVFGNGVLNWRGTAQLPSGKLAVPAFSVVFDSGVNALTFESDGTQTALTDLIRLDAGADIVVAYRGDVAGYTNVIELSIPETIAPEINEQLLGNCGRNAQAHTCAPGIINTVNGVRANAAGVLTIKIVNNTTAALGVSGNNTGGAKLTGTLSLTRACESKYVLDGAVDVSTGLIKKC